MVVDNREKILQFMKAKGPVLPFQIAKEIKTDIIMASAHLAELTATHKIKISHIKVGGSPLYYLSGQEEMLQKFIGGLNDKEKKAYDLLSEKKVLREGTLEPVIRVAVKDLKDFAFPLNVSFNGTSEVFWKWYITSDFEAEQLIKKELDIKEESPKLDEKPQKSGEPKPKEKAIAPEQRASFEEQEKDERQTRLKEEKSGKKVERKQRPKSDDSFLQNVEKFFSKNDISVLSTEVAKRGSEIDFVIEVPSIMGRLRYYCKAKNKKKLNDADLSNVFVKAQFKKLPAIIISNGELSSKASEILGKELNIVFKRI